MLIRIVSLVLFCFCCWLFFFLFFFFFQAEDGRRDLVRSRGLGDVYKGQALTTPSPPTEPHGPVLVLSIEGNIGIGKSTLLAGLARAPATDPAIAFCPELVDIWERRGLLHAMYTGRISPGCFQ